MSRGPTAMSGGALPHPPGFGGQPVAGNDWSALAGHRADPAPSVSVIVLHYRQPRQLARTLHALAHQQYPGDLEIIVVDDGSEPAPSVPPGVRLVRQARSGPRRSAARNLGVQASRGAVLCFLDADTTPHSDWVAQLTRLPALAPETLTVGRRRHARLNGVGVEADVGVAGPANELNSPRWLAAGYEASEDLLHAGRRDFRFIISAALCCTRWFFDVLSGFDESFDAYGGEDWEWAHRAWLAGAVFAHVPAAVAWHDGPDWTERRVDDGDGVDGPETTDGTDGTDGTERARRRSQKNAEAMRLAQLVTVPGHRPRGLLAARAETLIDFAVTLEPAAAFICLDALFAALPWSAARVPAELLGCVGDDPRILAVGEPVPLRAAWPALYLSLHAACTPDPVALAECCAGMLDRDEGMVHLRDAGGELMTLESSRHRARVMRWGPRAGLGVSERRPDWLTRLDPPDVEAYLGGWRR